MNGGASALRLIEVGDRLSVQQVLKRFVFALRHKK